MHAVLEERPIVSPPNMLDDPRLGATLLTFAADESIYEPTSEARYLYQVATGQVRILQTGPQSASRLAAILGTGDWFGIYGLAGYDRCNSRAIAASPATVWSVPIERVRERIDALPAMEANLVHYLAKRLQMAQEEAARLVFDDCNQRLIKKLIHFSQSAAATSSEQGVVLRITHEQLAQAVGAARETISLALTQLRQRNLLRTGATR